MVGTGRLGPGIVPFVLDDFDQRRSPMMTGRACVRVPGLGGRLVVGSCVYEGNERYGLEFLSSLLLCARHGI